MKIQKIIVAFVLASFLLVGCKEEAKKTENKKEVVVVGNAQKLNLEISGMTCEIGCAKTIASKLSKKEGIIAAKVSFKDSLATISFDADKISKKDIMSYVESIGGGDLYKVTETDKEVKSCGPDCKKPCCADKKTCDKKKADCKDKKDCDKKGATCDKKKADCKDKKECKKGVSCDKKATKTECKPDCKKECCAKKA